MNKWAIFTVLLCGAWMCHGYDPNIRDDVTTVPGDVTTATPFVCKTPGLFCKDCGTVVECYENEEGSMSESIIEYCNSQTGETCLKNACTTKPNPLCSNPNYHFKCTALGVFPDPFNCKNMHYCIRKGDGSYMDHIFTCSKNYSYDPITTYCKNKILNDTCPDDVYPVPICTKAGQRGALINKSIYYICLQDENRNMFPELHLCPHGSIFTVDKGCQ